MPALKAFGLKLKISGDDLFFPYAFSILLKFCWLTSITVTLIDYDKEYRCSDDHMLKVYLIIQMAVQLVMITIEATAMTISSKGTIANAHPRRHLKRVLYIQVAWFLVELMWNIVGVQWVFDPVTNCYSSHRILVLTRVFSIWNLTVSVLVLSYFFLRFGILRIFFERPPKTLKYESMAPLTSLSGRRLSSLSDSSLSQHRRQRSWQWRLQNVFFFLHLKDSQKSVFSAVSATLADAFTKFRGYVPTDILAGLALLRMDQSILRKRISGSYNADVSPNRVPVNFSHKHIRDHYLHATRSMLFAMGAYGWPFLVYSRHVKGLSVLIYKTLESLFTCRRSAMLEESVFEREILGDNCLKWNLHSVLKWTGISESDVIYANFESEVFCPSFYVAVDHREGEVVVAIRGTLSILDALTDLSAQPHLMMTKEGVKFYVHEGMLNTANALHLKLEGDGILQCIFRAYPRYKLVITGHSLGAGVASLLAIILRDVYPDLHCFAFSPPGGLLNLPAVHHTRCFITSIIVGNDLVPRLSLQNVEKLGDEILYQLKHSRTPKFRIFINQFLYWCKLYRPRHSRYDGEWCQRRPMRNTAHRVGGVNVHVMPSLLSDEELYVEDNYEERVYGKKPFIVTDPITGKTTKRAESQERHALYLPGRILHLTRGPLLPTCFGLRWYRPVCIEWTVQSEFGEIMVDQDMVSDHLPNVVYRTMADLARHQQLY